MRYFTKLSAVWLVVVWWSAVPVYADDGIRYAVDQYCEIYNPKSWKELAPDADVQTIYAQIVLQQKKRIRHPRVLDAIASADTGDFTRFYFSVKQNIESLLGEAWVCEHFDNFFLPKQRVVPLSLGKVVETRIDPNADHVMVIMSHTGELLIDNAPLVSSDAEKVKLGIKSKLGNRNIRDMQFVLYMDQGADGNRLAELLVTLSNMGIDKVQLIDY